MTLHHDAFVIIGLAAMAAMANGAMAVLLYHRMRSRVRAVRVWRVGPMSILNYTTSGSPWHE